VVIGLVLLLAAVVRAWSEFDHDSPLTWLYMAGPAGTLAGLVALYATLRTSVERASRG
jgi:hypothetical protein